MRKAKRWVGAGCEIPCILAVKSFVLRLERGFYKAVGLRLSLGIDFIFGRCFGGGCVFRAQVSLCLEYFVNENCEG